jgi:sugar phosphate permease
VVAAVLFFCSTINYADRTSITALFPLLKADLGYSDVALGALGSVFLWSYALASPLLLATASAAAA